MLEGFELGDGPRALAAEIMRQRPFEAFRAQPGFPDLVRDLTALWGARIGADTPNAERPLADITRFAGAIWINYLEATPGGLTLQRLDRTLKSVGMGGVGRARTIITYLSYIRYIEPAPREGDGRYKHFRTTDMARKVLRDRFRDELNVRGVAFPAALELADRIEDAALFDTFLFNASETSIALITSQLQTPNPIHTLSDRNRGLNLLSHLMACGEPGDSWPPRGPIHYSVSDLAKRCGASRMQIGHLLRTARDEGFILTVPDGRETLSEKTITGMEMLVASSTLLVVGAAKMALGQPAA